MPPANPSSQVISPKGTLLIVDDNPSNLVALQAVLDEYRVLSAESGKQALELLEANDVNVVLLDIQMPNMDGFETARRIKQMPRHVNTPIIFVTAVFKEDPYIKQGYQAGGIDYFTKPFDPDILKVKVGIYASFQQRDHLLKEREKRIRESEELLKAGHKLAAVLESLPVGVIISDSKAGILQTNDAVLAIWKSIDPTQSDAYGAFLKWWSGGGRTVKDAFFQALATGKATSSRILTIECFDGTTKTILSSASPLLGLDDRVVGAVAVLQDITQHKAIEAHMEKSILQIVSLGVELEQRTATI